MRLWPKSLAGRLAALLLVTLFVAQVITFALFAWERVSSFRNSFRQELFVRLVSLVDLVQDAPPELRQRLLNATRMPGFDMRLDSAPLVVDDGPEEQALRLNLASALGKSAADVHVTFDPPRPPPPDARSFAGRRPFRHHHAPAWITISMRIADGEWLNASADRPPVPPLGRVFLLSFLISAIGVATVGAFGIRYASRPLKRLAGAADRLGRGEGFEPLPETGPEETRQANVAFNRMRERLDRYIRDRTAMLAAIAHDLRTPITSLRLRAEFVEDEETKTKILETLAEMQAMAEAVLAFARGDAVSEETRATDVSALVESVCEDIAASGRDTQFLEFPRGDAEVPALCAQACHRQPHRQRNLLRHARTGEGRGRR